MSVNKVILVGNVGKDPEVAHLTNGNIVANFSLATTEKYKNKDNEVVTNTEWHNVVLYGKLAEIAEKYVKKGQQLYLEGKLKTSSWEDKDNNKRYKTEVICNSLQMLGRKTDNVQSTTGNEQVYNSEQEGDLPF